TMADAEHAPAMAPPVRTDEQILPRIRWVPIRKSNCYLNEEKSQPIPIYKIVVDILKQTNFFRAFTASLTIPAIYIQQFRDTICFDSKAESYKCQLDEQWFDLTKDTLRDALQITPVDNNRAFSPPLTPDTLIDFVNELGYPKEVIHLSNVTINDMFQPWRALTTIINLCITRKTSGFERPRAPRTKGIGTNITWGRRKLLFILIRVSDSTKLIHISPANGCTTFHPRTESPLSFAYEENCIVISSYVAKGCNEKFFGMTIPNELINDVIRGADYYDAYLEKVAKHQREDKRSRCRHAVRQVSPLAKRAKAGKVVKKRTVKSSKQLVDEFIDEGGIVTGELNTAEVPGKGKEKVGEEQAAQVLLHLQTTKKKSPTEHDTESDDEMPSVVRSGAQDEGQAGPDPGKLDEGQAGPNPDDVAESQPLQLLNEGLIATATKKKSKQDSPKTLPGSPPSPPPPPPPPLGASGASGTTGASDSAQAPPPPPPSLSTHQGDQSMNTAAPRSSKTAASAKYSAWTTTDTRIKPSIITIPDDLYMDDETTADEQEYSSGDEVGCDHIPTVNLRKSWWKPLTEDRLATPEPAWTISSSDLTMPTNNWAYALKLPYAPPQENSLLGQTEDMAIFMDWYYKRQGITHPTLQDLEGPAFEIVKVFHPDVIHLQFQMEECHKLLIDQVDDTILRYNVSKPLPLGGEPGHVGRPALSISKMKAAYYSDVGLEQLVPDQFWIEAECKYDITAMYGISYWWFQRQRFYIYRFSSEGDRRAVRTHMRILSVIRIEVFSMYGYNYMKKIVLHRADLKEYVIAERDFKYINLVIRQHVEDFQLGIKSYQMQLNLTKLRWEATGFEFKHDFTVIDSPRAVIFRDKYGVQMIMRFNEIYKFSDGTLQ
ncbi:hypothetical protein Tco_0390186, partial [Tanacetum coccineum]